MLDHWFLLIDFCCFLSNSSLLQTSRRKVEEKNYNNWWIFKNYNHRWKIFFFRSCYDRRIWSHYCYANIMVLILCCSQGGGELRKRNDSKNWWVFKRNYNQRWNNFFSDHYNRRTWSHYCRVSIIHAYMYGLAFLVWWIQFGIDESLPVSQSQAQTHVRTTDRQKDHFEFKLNHPPYLADSWQEQFTFVLSITWTSFSSLASSSWVPVPSSRSIILKHGQTVSYLKT